MILIQVVDLFTLAILFIALFVVFYAAVMYLLKRVFDDV